MAKIKIEDVVDHLEPEFRRALEDTLKEHFPGARFDVHNVFRTFKRNVYQKCNVWEQIPDEFIEK